VASLLLLSLLVIAAPAVVTLLIATALPGDGLTIDDQPSPEIEVDSLTWSATNRTGLGVPIAVGLFTFPPLLCMLLPSPAVALAVCVPVQVLLIGSVLRRSRAARSKPTSSACGSPGDGRRATPPGRTWTTSSRGTPGLLSELGVARVFSRFRGPRVATVPR
jgi:hypothetical protein